MRLASIFIPLTLLLTVATAQFITLDQGTVNSLIAGTIGFKAGFAASNLANNRPLFSPVRNPFRQSFRRRRRFRPRFFRRGKREALEEPISNEVEEWFQRADELDFDDCGKKFICEVNTKKNQKVFSFRPDKYLSMKQNLLAQYRCRSGTNIFTALTQQFWVSQAFQKIKIQKKIFLQQRIYFLR